MSIFLRRLSSCTLAALLAVGGLSACSTTRPADGEFLQAAVSSGDAMAIYDALEARIAAGIDTPRDRKAAFRALRDRNEDTAGFQFAWAAVGGRLVQQKGLLGIELVSQVERHARRSRELDPDFRGGVATRLLGTLYVVAPGKLLEFGNSELGLELLEELVEKYPEVPENHLRVAEAYIALGDPEPAGDHLCFCIARKADIRPDEQKLLENLIADAGPFTCPPAK